MSIEDELGSRRQQIVSLVLRHGAMTVAELAESLGVAKTSLRPQLDRLVLQGWLDRDQRRQGPGRPADVFTASERSREQFAQVTVAEFARSLLAEMVETESHAKVSSVMDGVGRRLTEILRPIVGDGPPAERVRRLQQFLDERGILTDVDENRQTTTLNIHTCPYVGLACAHPQVCEMHRQAVAEILGGKIIRHNCRHDGHPCCDFKVDVADSNGAASKRRGGTGGTRKTNSAAKK